MRKKLFLLLVFIVIVFVVAKTWNFITEVAPTATRIILHPGATIQEVNGHTNVLLLGIGGGTHDGPDLTDTIMLANIDWKANKVTLISVPRDLWFPDLSGSVKKINSAYADGESDNQHKGLILAKAAVQEVTGQQIQYALRLDFQGFVDAINEIGGVDVNVQHTLDDYNYPISGMEDDTCQHTPEELQAFNATLSASLNPELETFNFFSCRFKHLHFDPGVQHMDGETALEFARSRHGVGSEGSDFARSARQQLIIEAVRNKLISSALLSPGKLLGLYTIMKSSIDTDISPEELGLFMDKSFVLKDAKIQSAVIDLGDYTTGRFGLLNNAPVGAEYDYAAALIPRVGNGDFSEIHNYVNCEILKGNCTVASLTPSPSAGTMSTTKK